MNVTDPGLLRAAARDVNDALPVRPGGECSDVRRPDTVDRTYHVRFASAGKVGPDIEVPLGCTPLGVVGASARFLVQPGGTDDVRLAYDQQISVSDQCLGIGGPSGGPPAAGYIGLTLDQAQQHADATGNDVIRVAGHDGVCTGIVRDDVVNRVNVYFNGGVVVAAKSF